ARLKVEELSFDKAELECSIEAYKDYIERFPGSDQTKTAAERIQAFEQGIHPEWKSVKRVKIQLKLSYPEGAELPFVFWTGRILGRMGIEVLEGDVSNPDATLTINSTGKALGDSYGQIGTIYTGASVSGNISLDNHRGTIRRKVFEGRKKPIDVIYVEKSEIKKERKDRTPGSAPFEEALLDKGSFAQRLLEILQESFGTRVLIYSLGVGTDAFRESAFSALIRLKDPQKSSLLIDGLTHKNPGVRRWSARVLGEVRERKAVDALIEMIEREVYSVRVEAARALGRIKDPKAVEALVRSLDRGWGPNNYKTSIIEALGNIGDNRAIEVLLKILKKAQEDYSGYFTNAAANALQKITGQKFKGDYQAWADWREKKKLQ
ncbi:HEAT repeat domain-containing protein, partial [Acidobacteriota bacterium]